MKKRKDNITMLRFFILITVLFLINPRHSAFCGDENTKQLTLSESINIALERNAVTRAADYQVTGAEFERKAAITGFLPKISTEHTYTRYDEAPFAKSPAGEFGPSAIKYRLGTRDHYEWNTSVIQPLFTGGAILSSYQIAKLGLDIAKENRNRTRNEIILQTKEAYFNILKAEKLKAVAGQAVEQVKSHVEVAKAFYEEEMVPRNDLLEAEVRLAQITQNLIRADNAVQVAKAYFNRVLSRNLNEPVELEDIISYKPDEISLDDALRESVEKRPEIKEAAYNVEKADRSVNLSKSSYYPALSLVGNYRQMGENPGMNGSPYEDDHSWTISTVLRWEIWDWGNRYFKVGSTRAQLSQETELKRKVSEDISLEVKESYLNLRETESSINVAETAIKQAEENFRIYKEQYNEQMATSTDVLDARQLLTEAQNNYYSSLSNYHIAKARLDRAIGRESW